MRFAGALFCVTVVCRVLPSRAVLVRSRDRDHRDEPSGGQQRRGDDREAAALALRQAPQGFCAFHASLSITAG